MVSEMQKHKTNSLVKLDARDVYYRDLNAMLREAVAQGAKRIELRNVCGQRYIGTDLRRSVEIDIYGTPGNDLGAFMDGPRITVYGNAQDGCGNTMNEGEIVVHGHAGDITGFAMRGGGIFVRDDVGYRVGIHMKEYEKKCPVLVIGGTAQDFLGEYMAGGILAVLGLTLKEGESHKANFIGTGMHGGVIYLRGSVRDHQLGKEVGVLDLDDRDWSLLTSLVTQFASHFNDYDAAEILAGKFTKLVPQHLRPYGRLYAY
jgi:glutamate synthase domain-containing protein 3